MFCQIDSSRKNKMCWATEEEVDLFDVQRRWNFSINMWSCLKIDYGGRSIENNLVRVEFQIVQHLKKELWEMKWSENKRRVKFCWCTRTNMNFLFDFVPDLIYFRNFVVLSSKFVDWLLYIYFFVIPQIYLRSCFVNMLWLNCGTGKFEIWFWCKMFKLVVFMLHLHILQFFLVLNNLYFLESRFYSEIMLNFYFSNRWKSFSEFELKYYFSRTRKKLLATLKNKIVV